jgi:hypothetical protein
VILSPALTWPAVCAAAGAGFIICCATVAIAGGFETHSASAPPWDRINRSGQWRKLCMYAVQWLGVALGCAVIAVGMLCVPVLPILAVGVAPRAALRALGGGTVEAERTVTPRAASRAPGGGIVEAKGTVDSV